MPLRVWTLTPFSGGGASLATIFASAAGTIETMGSKTAARVAARHAGVPVVPGTEEPFEVAVPDHVIGDAARAIGYPVLVKAVAGGGGKVAHFIEDVIGGQQHFRLDEGDGAVFEQSRRVHDGFARFRLRRRHPANSRG